MFNRSIVWPNKLLAQDEVQFCLGYVLGRVSPALLFRRCNLPLRQVQVQVQMQGALFLKAVVIYPFGLLLLKAVVSNPSWLSYSTTQKRKATLFNPYSSDVSHSHLLPPGTLGFPISTWFYRFSTDIFSVQLGFSSSRSMPYSFFRFSKF